MRNKKVIVVSGFSRGGTNILWNIFQSHPEICSASFETGTIFHKKRHKFSRVISVLRRTGLIRFKPFLHLMDYQFFRYKMRNYTDRQNKYKFEGETYNKEEVKNAAICFKSVDYDIFHTDHLLRMYPDLYFIGLARNGYATAEGHLRRGRSVQDFGKLYNKIAGRMEKYSRELKKFKLVKFEDILEHPFKVAGELFEFTDCRPVELEKLRLKSKKIIKKDGVHQATFGVQGEKYWFDKKSIGDILDPGVNKKQLERLDRDVIEEFNNEAREALTFFGYEILNPDY